MFLIGVGQGFISEKFDKFLFLNLIISFIGS